MQVSSISFTKTGGKKSAIKSSKGDFGDLLKGIEENGNISVMQLLASGFVFPQPQMMQNQVLQNGGQQGGNTQAQQNSGEPLTEVEMPGTVQSAALNLGQPILAQNTVNSAEQPSAVQNPNDAVSQGIMLQNVNRGFVAQADIPSDTKISFSAQGILNQKVTSGTDARTMASQETPLSFTEQAKPIQNTIVHANSLQNTLTDFTVQSSLPMNFTAKEAPLHNSVQNSVQTINSQKVSTQEAVQPAKIDGASTNTIAQQVATGTAEQDVTAQAVQVRNTANIVKIEPGAQITQNNVQQSSNNVLNATLKEAAAQPTAVDVKADNLSINTGKAVNTDSISEENTAEFGQVLQNVQSGTAKQSTVKPETAQSDSVIKTSALSSSPKKTSGNSQDNKSFQDGEKQNDNQDFSQYPAIAVQQSSAVNKTTAATQAEKTNAAAQVANAVKQAVDSGRHEIRLHLSPEDLGGISIKIVSQDGALSLQITADNAHTGQLISSSMHELSQTMQNQGLSMGKTEVMYSQGDMFGASAGSQQQADRQNHNAKAPIFSLMQNEKVEPIQETEPVKSGRISILA